MDQPLKVLCELGGWKTAKTVLQCYQRADEDRLRKALASRCTTLPDDKRSVVDEVVSRHLIPKYSRFQSVGSRKRSTARAADRAVLIELT